ncbi:MAG TPA: hypothetical protein VL337_15355 [Acidimicrobiales bacterium]|nr:hypothetical protein [Acidimicrobiales bacterium]
MTLGLVAVLCTPALLFVTTLLERLIAVPVPHDHGRGRRQSNFYINRKAR